MPRPGKPKSRTEKPSSALSIACCKTTSGKQRNRPLVRPHAVANHFSEDIKGPCHVSSVCASMHEVGIHMYIKPDIVLLAHLVAKLKGLLKFFASVRKLNNN